MCKQHDCTPPSSFNLSLQLQLLPSPLQVTVALVDLQPELYYISVPRLSPHSFLQAKAMNTSSYTVLAGPANIFLDSNFIAKVLSLAYEYFIMHYQEI